MVTESALEAEAEAKVNPEALARGRLERLQKVPEAVSQAIDTLAAALPESLQLASKINSEYRYLLTQDWIEVVKRMDEMDDRRSNLPLQPHLQVVIWHSYHIPSQTLYVPFPNEDGSLSDFQRQYQTEAIWVERLAREIDPKDIANLPEDESGKTYAALDFVREHDPDFMSAAGKVSKLLEKSDEKGSQLIFTLEEEVYQSLTPLEKEVAFLLLRNRISKLIGETALSAFDWVLKEKGSSEEIPDLVSFFEREGGSLREIEREFLSSSMGNTRTIEWLQKVYCHPLMTHTGSLLGGDRNPHRRNFVAQAKKVAIPLDAPVSKLKEALGVGKEVKREVGSEGDSLENERLLKNVEELTALVTHEQLPTAEEVQARIADLQRGKDEYIGAVKALNEKAQGFYERKFRKGFSLGKLREKLGDLSEGLKLVQKNLVSNLKAITPYLETLGVGMVARAVLVPLIASQFNLSPALIDQWMPIATGILAVGAPSLKIAEAMAGKETKKGRILGLAASVAGKAATFGLGWMGGARIQEAFTSHFAQPAVKEAPSVSEPTATPSPAPKQVVESPPVQHRAYFPSVSSGAEAAVQTLTPLKETINFLPKEMAVHQGDFHWRLAAEWTKGFNLSPAAKEVLTNTVAKVNNLAQPHLQPGSTVEFSNQAIGETVMRYVKHLQFGLEQGWKMNIPITNEDLLELNKVAIALAG